MPELPAEAPVDTAPPAPDDGFGVHAARGRRHLASRLSGPPPATARGYAEPDGQGRGSTPKQSDSFLESLMDTSLYSMGAYFSDEHPDLVDEVIAQSEAIEAQGIRAYSAESGLSAEACFETLLTGLAVRYYNAVAA